MPPPPAPARRAAGVAPTLTEPGPGAVVPLDAVTFRWTAPPGAGAFALRVASAAAPDAPLVEIDGLATTEATLADALPGGPMLAWVRRGDGPWSAPARFVAGTPGDVEAARAAEAEIAEAQRTAQRAAERLAPRVREAPLPEAPPEPVWPYASGEALDGAPPVDWSAVPGFGPPAPAVRPRADAVLPRPLGPLGGEIVDAAALALAWTSAPGAAGYDVELSPDARFGGPVLALDAGPATEVNLAGLVPPAGRVLHWRVRARYADGAVSAWSRFGRFYPAGAGEADRFRAALAEARMADRRRRDHARLVRQRALDLVPLHERGDAVTSAAAAGTLIAMMLSSAVILLAAVLAAVLLG